MLATIECVKGEKVRYEFFQSKLVPAFASSQPFVQSYGFINDTLQADGDSLDCYILSRKKLKLGQQVQVFAVVAIVCFDDGKRDDKYICVTPDYRPSKRKIKRETRKIIRAIRKHKKGTVIIGVRDAGHWLYYELVKYRVFDMLFGGGQDK